MAGDKSILDNLADHLDKSLRLEIERSGLDPNGPLSKSFRHTIQTALDGVKIVGEMLFYGEHVTKGRKPGKKGVPVHALMDFILRRKIESDITKVKSIAFAIQKSIINKGIKPNPFIERMLKSKEAKIEGAVSLFLGSLVETELRNIFKNFS